MKNNFTSVQILIKPENFVYSFDFFSLVGYAKHAEYTFLTLNISRIQVDLGK